MLKYLLNEWMRPDFSHLQNGHNRIHPTHCCEDYMKNMYFKLLAQQSHLPSFRMAPERTTNDQVSQLERCGGGDVPGE